MNVDVKIIFWGFCILIFGVFLGIVIPDIAYENVAQILNFIFIALATLLLCTFTIFCNKKKIITYFLRKIHSINSNSIKKIISMWFESQILIGTAILVISTIVSLLGFIILIKQNSLISKQTKFLCMQSKILIETSKINNRDMKSRYYKDVIEKLNLLRSKIMKVVSIINKCNDTRCLQPIEFESEYKNLIDSVNLYDSELNNATLGKEISALENNLKNFARDFGNLTNFIITKNRNNLRPDGFIEYRELRFKLRDSHEKLMNSLESYRVSINKNLSHFKNIKNDTKCNEY